MRISLVTWAGLFLAATPSLAAIFDRAESLPDVSFDFVIVGGGTAGSVLANRLTENPNFNVLVIEDGPTNQGVLDSMVPFFDTTLENSAFDWNFTTTPQHGLNGRILAYPRGHILGGSSSINAMFYTRGSSSDYNRFATVTGDPGWSWDNVQPYIRKNEMWTPPADNHDTSGQFDPAVHGFNGINSVSLGGFSHSTDATVIQTTAELKDEFPFNRDMNSGNPLGVGWLQSTIKDGERSSSATSYLGPKFVTRRNLHILLQSRVTRILQTGAGGSEPTFRTVEFTQSIAGPRTQITASKELILSAGTIGTPHILLHSGIGDESELETVGIKPLVNLPSVGKNLSDQPLLGNAWSINSNDTLNNFGGNATLVAQFLQQWQTNRTGPLVDAGVSHLMWLRLPATSPIFQKVVDPSSGPNTPHYELALGTGGGLRPASGHSIGLGSVVVTPASRGSVTLGTTNPFDQPLIDPGFLGSEFDIFAMREAIKSARRFVAAPAWKGIVIGPVGALANATTDDLLDQYIRGNAFTSAHPVGTAGMSAKGARYGVVDPDLRVKGVSGLRIVDASVMPFITCGHTQAPVYIIAERGADLIKSAWEQ